MAGKTDDVGNEIADSADTSPLDLFNGQSVTELKGVRVFDIGQGDCIGLRDQNDDVFCYVDYGGVNDHPDKNTPSHTKKRMPVKSGGNFVSILITHWDKDHYWSANKKNPDAQDCYWLVPRQHVSPQATKLAAKLTNAECWPESIGDSSVDVAIGADWKIEIRKCDAFDKHDSNQDRNLCGLAVTLHQEDANGDETMMLLPGDCPFDQIPNMPSVPICALVAYHHGSNVHWKSATTNAISNRHSNCEMAYSFGKNNYGHPDQSNYQPDWDSYATKTADIRHQSLEFHDMDW